MTEVVLGSTLTRTFEVDHVDTSDHRELAAVGRIDLRNIVLAFRHALAFWLALARRPDLCYLPIGRSRVALLRDFMFLLPARIARKPVVVHFHSRDFADYYKAESFWMRWLIRLSLRGETHAVVLGNSRSRDFGSLIGQERVHVVPNGIPDFGVGESPSSRGRTVLHLSSLRKDKGVLTVLSVANELKDIPGLSFAIAGEWSRDADRCEAQEYVRSHGLEKIVQFVGPVAGAKKVELLRRAAVMLFPSTYRYEGHPVVVVEAMCAGTPVVATPIATLPETVDDESGFLIPADDLDRMTATTRSLLLDLDRRDRMGRAARRRYEESFTVESFSMRLGEVWRVVLSKGASRRSAESSPDEAASRPTPADGSPAAGQPTGR